MASPRLMSKYSRQQELELESRPTNVKLSERTSARLAELRARRAAQEEDECFIQTSPRRDVGASRHPAASPRREPVLLPDTPVSKKDPVSSSDSANFSSDVSSVQASPRHETVSHTPVASPRKEQVATHQTPTASPRREPTVTHHTPTASPRKVDAVTHQAPTASARKDHTAAYHTPTDSPRRPPVTRRDLHSPKKEPITSIDTSSPSPSERITSSNTSVSKLQQVTMAEPVSPPTSYRDSIASSQSELNDSLDSGYYSKYSKPINSSLNYTAGSSYNSPLPDTKDFTKNCKEYRADYTSDRPNFGGPRAANIRNITDTDDDDSVGFSSLPEQVHRKALKRGFDFTLMVVGESGLGKSTLIQSLFLNTDLYNDRNILPVEERLKKTVQIEKRYMEIEERGVKLRLTIVDTPGYNDSLTAEDGWKPVETYIDQQFDQYFKDESGLNRKNIKDNRVHCCLYFISPFGHGLRQIDIHFMKRLHHKVNIVPIIAKADTLTRVEIRKMKTRVMEQIANNDIHIYEFPDCDSDEDEEFKKQDQELKASIPFSVIGSNTIVEVNGKKIRGRLYPWGIVDVDNSDHCDFTKLRQMLISTHMQDLKDVTRDIHYENFRAKHITEEMSKQAARERNPHLFDEHITVVRSNSKLKRDSSPNFENIVQTDALLQQKDEEIKKMQQMLVAMQKQLQQQSPHSSPQHLNGALKNL